MCILAMSGSQGKRNQICKKIVRKIIFLLHFLAKKAKIHVFSQCHIPHSFKIYYPTYPCGISECFLCVKSL